MSIERRVGLRPLLMGPPLNERQHSIESDPTMRCLDSHMSGLVTLLPKIYGNTEACQQAVYEFKALAKQPPASRDAVCCKRAALLFSLCKEKEVGQYFATQERAVAPDSASYAEDMRDRVLPFLVPRFLKNSCQTPDSMVTLALILSEMWAGEKLGNWPLMNEPAQTGHDAAVAELHDRAHGKG